MCGPWARGPRGPVVQQTVGPIGVLSEIHVTRVGVDHHCLVGESTECLDRFRIAVAAQVVGIDLEDVAVVLQETTASFGFVLFAGQPGSPRCHASSTVAEGACQRDHFGEAPTVLVSGEGCGAAKCRTGIVGETGTVRNRLNGRGSVLVVRDQNVAGASLTPEASGAVVAGGRLLSAVGQRG